MGDRCYLEITLRRSDLDRFGKRLDAAPGEEWWERLDEEASQPGIVTASVHEANYAWLDERLAAAQDGIDFHGWHAEGGEYGPYEFAAFRGKHLDAAPGEEWWDHLDEEATQPGIVTASVYEANYAWYDERCAAAKEGIDFRGWHAEGGEYGPYEFAAFRGKHLEAERNHDGELVIAVDENLRPLAGMAHLRKYVRILKKVKAAFARAEPAAELEAA